MRIAIVARGRSPHGAAAGRLADALALRHTVSLWVPELGGESLVRSAELVRVGRAPWRLTDLANMDALLYWLGPRDAGSGPVRDIASVRPGFALLDGCPPANVPPGTLGLMLPGAAAIEFAGPVAELPPEDAGRVDAVDAFVSQHAPHAPLLALSDRAGRALHDVGGSADTAAGRLIAGVLADLYTP